MFTVAFNQFDFNHMILDLNLARDPMAQCAVQFSSWPSVKLPSGTHHKIGSTIQFKSEQLERVNLDNWTSVKLQPDRFNPGTVLGFGF